MENEDKLFLKAGDVVKFHNWFVGGFLFGIVIETGNPDIFYHSKLRIWRPRSSYLLGDVDAVELIETVEDVKDYDRYEFETLLNAATDANVYHQIKKGK